MNNDTYDPRKTLTHLLNSQSFGVLSTEGDTAPYANLVAFAVSKDLEHMIFMTKRDTHKFANLQNHPIASMLVDSRTNSAADFSKAIAVTVMGSTRELEGVEREDMSRILAVKHPFLENYLTLPTTAVLSLDVSLYRLVEEFQKVTDFEIRA